jgi:ATP-dependent helicase/nuclease subunit B
MHEEIFRALEAGATLITASSHLARVLTREFHGMEKARGRSVWNRPDILPLEAFLDRVWRERLWRDEGDASVLLNALQEQALWEQIIRESPAGASLLQIPETARQAVRTWQLIAAYRVPVDGSFEASEDWSAFAAWSREFRRRCLAHGWMERAQLSDVLREKMAGPELPRPSIVYAAGFDDMTAQQTDFLGALGEWRAVERPNHSPTVERWKLRDSTGEIRAAAAWARRLLEQEPKTQIGMVVVPDLTTIRSKIERIFRATFEPGSDSSEREHAFHLSVGPPLADYPIVGAALLMLDFAVGSMALPRAGMLLRSPFLAGAEVERSKRALLDAKLRKRSVWDVGVTGLRDAAGSCPELQHLLRRVEKRVQSWPKEQRPSEWSRAIVDLLEAFGWPGERTPSSREYQTIEAWYELLSNLAALDLTTPSMNLWQIVERLHEMAENSRFQVEDEGAPVQVMGMLEAAGLHFDHLWIMGLHDEALPASANPNPFLPTALQRAHGLPHSSAERELEFATKLIGRLLISAPDVVLSYPETDGDRALAPSALVAGGRWLEGYEETNEWITRMRASAVFDEIPDGTAPELVHSDSTGGTSLFKDMAACPFRAFARHRLGARPLEDADLGLSYSDRGTSVHKALEYIWREIGSRARLMDLSPRELEAVIERGADAAVAKLGPGIGRDLEKQRLHRLLPEWLELEKLRSEFTVAQTEAESLVAMGGLQIRTRADRVDALPDGREIILDYKTGQLKTRGWEGDRPDEPQLPLYCATSDRPVAGAAFALIRTGELRFRGLTSSGVNLPAMAKMPIDPAIPFERQLAAWKLVLQQLAEDFRGGRANVDPKPGACDNCGLRALCRVREFERGVQG